MRFLKWAILGSFKSWKLNYQLKRRFVFLIRAHCGKIPILVLKLQKLVEL